NGPEKTGAAERQMSFRRERRPFSQIHGPMVAVGAPLYRAGALGLALVPPVLATQSGCNDTNDAIWSDLSACISWSLSSLRTWYDLPSTSLDAYVPPLVWIMVTSEGRTLLNEKIQSATSVWFRSSVSSWPSASLSAENLVMSVSVPALASCLNIAIRNC